MSPAKIHFSAEELQLLSSSDFILTKNEILRKIHLFLSELLETQAAVLSEYKDHLPAEVLKVSPKISKGENYMGLPWQVLDQPRHFEAGNTFAIRTLFWWGQFFSTTLHLSGRYKNQFENKIFSINKSNDANEFFVCIAEDQWQHHMESSNYIRLRDAGSEQLQQIQKRNFIKLAQITPLQQTGPALRKLEQDYKEILKMLTR